MNFVNHLGETVSIERLAAQAPKKKARPQKDSFHNGWRVQGIPPGALEDARKAADAEAAHARRQGQEPKAWDEQHWLMNAKRKPVRSKPYEIPAAAEECRRLAQAAGWLRVEIVELKKEAA